MCCFSKSIAAPVDVPTTVPTTVKPVGETKQKNKNYSSKEDRLGHLTNYYVVKILTDAKLLIQDYITDHKLPRSTFQDHWGFLEVAKKLKEKMPVTQFREFISNYLDIVETNMKVRTEPVSLSNRYLTDNEERQFLFILHNHVQSGLRNFEA
jgi:hypothetical protein